MWVVGDAANSLATCCTPALFLLIGMKVQRPGLAQAGIIGVLIFRTGLALLFVSLVNTVFALPADKTMFWLFFSNSAISFWPYMHIVGCTQMEMTFLEEVEKEQIGIKVVDEDIGPPLPSNKQQSLYSMSMSVDLEEVVSVCNSPRLSCCSTSTLLTLNLGLTEDVFNLTFDDQMALMILSVSFTWTVFVCTVFALTPHYLWTRSSNLAIEGFGMLFIGSLLMFVFARLARMTDTQVDTDCKPDWSPRSPSGSICFDGFDDLATNQEVKETDSKDNDKICISPCIRCNEHVRTGSGTTTTTCCEDDCHNSDEESWSDPDNFASA